MLAVEVVAGAVLAGVEVVFVWDGVVVAAPELAVPVVGGIIGAKEVPVPVTVVVPFGLVVVLVVMPLGEEGLLVLAGVWVGVVGLVVLAELVACGLWVAASVICNGTMRAAERTAAKPNKRRALISFIDFKRLAFM